MVIKENITNDLVFKYGESAKQNNISLIDEVLYGANSTEEDKQKLSEIIVSGSPCDDRNALTENDSWDNLMCSGTFIDGTPCNMNPTLEDMIYMNNICSGGNVKSGTVMGIPSYQSPNGTCSGVIREWTGTGWNYPPYQRRSLQLKTINATRPPTGYACYAMQERIASGYSYAFAFDWNSLDNPSCAKGTLISATESNVLSFTYQGVPKYETRVSNAYTCAVCPTDQHYDSSTKKCLAN